MTVVYVLSNRNCDDCKGYHIVDIFENKNDAEERKKNLELVDKEIYGFEVSSYFLKGYEVL